MSNPRVEVPTVEQIEQFKENIQPARGGRSVGGLAKRLHDSSHVSVQIEQQKLKFEKRLVDDVEAAISDPLVTWIEYLTWAKVLFFL